MRQHMSRSMHLTCGWKPTHMPRSDLPMLLPYLCLGGIRGTYAVIKRLLQADYAVEEAEEGRPAPSIAGLPAARVPAAAAPAAVMEQGYEACCRERGDCCMSYVVADLQGCVLACLHTRFGWFSPNTPPGLMSLFGSSVHFRTCTVESLVYQSCMCSVTLTLMASQP